MCGVLLSLGIISFPWRITCEVLLYDGMRRTRQNILDKHQCEVTQEEKRLREELG